MTYRSLSTWPILFALAFALPAAPATAGVLVVDLAGGGDFLDVDDAVLAASDGDVVLIKPGNYAAGLLTPVIIDNKSLTLVGDGAKPSLTAILVRNLAPGKKVVLRNLHGHANHIILDNDFTNLNVVNCAGRVWVEDCVFEGGDGSPGFQGAFATPGHTAAFVRAANCVVLTRCMLIGGDGVSTSAIQKASSVGAPGLLIDDGFTPSRVALYECTVTGGNGGSDMLFTGPTPGSPAIDVRAQGSLFIAGSALTGGDGGSGGTDPADAAAGSGVRSVTDPFVLTTLDVTCVPGAPGSLSGGGSGVPALCQDLAAGATVFALPGTNRTSVVTSVLRENTNGTLSLHGDPGDTALVFLGTAAGFQPKNVYGGIFLLGPVLFDPIVLGALPPSGSLVLNLAVPQFPAGVEGDVLLSQTFLLPASGGARLTSPTAFIFVGAGF